MSSCKLFFPLLRSESKRVIMRSEYCHRKQLFQQLVPLKVKRKVSERALAPRSHAGHTAEPSDKSRQVNTSLCVQPRSSTDRVCESGYYYICAVPVCFKMVDHVFVLHAHQGRQTTTMLHHGR